MDTAGAETLRKRIEEQQRLRRLVSSHLPDADGEAEDDLAENIDVASCPALGQWIGKVGPAAKPSVDLGRREWSEPEPDARHDWRPSWIPRSRRLSR